MSAADRFGPSERTLPALLERQAAALGAAPFVAFEGLTWTFAEARDVAARTAGTLAAAGVGPGDRVALILSNRPEFLALFFGCLWLGAVAVPINTASRGMQLTHILANCGTRLLVIEAAFADNLATVDRERVAVDTMWSVGGDVADGTALPATGEARPASAAGQGDLAAVIYTSGTTGPSKGVCCPNANLFWWGANTADLLELGAGERLHTVLPLFHVNALNTVYQALITGSTVIVGTRFSASGLWRALGQSRASVTYLLGAMVPMLLARPPGPHDRAHSVRIGLGPGVPVEFHEPFAARFGFALVEGYGSTETNFVIGARLGEGRPGTMGTVRPGFAARVVDEGDEPVPDGTAGELVLRADAPFVFMTGYFAMPEATLAAWRNLWFHIGDRVIRDPDRAFRFVDRMKDAIRRRGENISSFEVEEVLLGHPGIAAAAVFPVASELAEDEVMAALVAGTVAPKPADIIAFCRDRLAHFAIPRYLEFVDALPTTENGKVQKFRLRERGAGPATWDREAHGVDVR